MTVGASLLPVMVTPTLAVALLALWPSVVKTPKLSLAVWPTPRLLSPEGVKL